VPYNRYYLCPTFLKCVRTKAALGFGHDSSHRGHELGQVIVHGEEAENVFL
jgi:hypothetical protein